MGARDSLGWLKDVYKLDDGFALAGRTGSFNQNVSFFWLIITNEHGDLTNQYIYRPQEWTFCECYSVIQCDDGGFLLGGWKDGGPAERFTVIRTNREGELLWSMILENPSRCYAVIELKDGNYVGCGRITVNGSYHCYAVKFNDEGELIWEQNFDGWRFWAVKEVDNGYIFAGHRGGGGSLIVKTDENGEAVWERTYDQGPLRDLISCRNGGFAATGGGRGNRHYLLRINDNGERLWERLYNVGGEANGLVEMPDGGFIIAGSNRRAELIRTDAEGNQVWYRNDNGGGNGARQYYSVVAGEDGFAYAVGWSQRRGYLIKVVPVRSAPVITDFIPESLNLSLLLNDSLRFSVSAIDWQEDSLRYLWTQNGDTLQPDTVANDTSAIVIIFDELSADTVQCTVSDSALSDSIRWIVHVEELYIDSYSPQTLSFSIRRNSTIDFSVTTRAIEDDPVEYHWLLNDEQIAENDSVSIRFERGREHSVTAIASQGELSDSVTWQVMVNDLIVDYMPEQLELSVEVDTTLEFEVFPFDPNDDSLQFLWTLDGDSISDNSWVLVNFDAEGLYNITAYVSDTTESDSLTWTVNVTPNRVYLDEPHHSDTPVLYPPAPNPFNSQTRISYHLPIETHLDLELYDISGRQVMRLVSGVRPAGEWSATLDGSDLTSGLYLIRMKSEEQSLSQKVLLVK